MTTIVKRYTITNWGQYTELPEHMELVVPDGAECFEARYLSGVRQVHMLSWINSDTGEGVEKRTYTLV